MYLVQFSRPCKNLVDIVVLASNTSDFSVVNPPIAAAARQRWFPRDTTQGPGIVKKLKTQVALLLPNTDLQKSPSSKQWFK